MPEEHKEHEEHTEEHHEHKEGEHGEHKGSSAKQKKLLYWGLGIAGAGLLVSLLLYKNGGSNAQDQTVANPSTPFYPNPTDASQNEYWPVLQSNPATGQVTGTSGGTSSSGSTSSGSSSSGSSSKKKKKSSGSSSKSSSSSSKKSSSSKTVKPNPTAGGAHGWVYTAKGGENVQTLFSNAWPGNTMNFGYTYANNAALLKSENINKQNGILKKGQKVIL